MGQFVGNIAVLSTWSSERANDNDPAIVNLEGGGGKRESLQSLQLFEFADVHQVCGVNDRHLQMFGKVTRVKAIMRGESKFIPNPRCLAFGFCLETAS